MVFPIHPGDSDSKRDPQPIQTVDVERVIGIETNDRPSRRSTRSAVDSALERLRRRPPVLRDCVHQLSVDSPEFPQL